MRSELAGEALRARIQEIESKGRRVSGALPFGLASMDARLPAGGLELGALHEVAGGGNGAVDGGGHVDDLPFNQEAS